MYHLTLAHFAVNPTVHTICSAGATHERSLPIHIPKPLSTLSENVRNPKRLYNQTPLGLNRSNQS